MRSGWIAGMFVAGCSPSAETIGALPSTGSDSTGSGSAASASSTDAASTGLQDSDASTTAASGDATSSGEVVGPVVRVHVAATTDPWPHADGLSGQTPREGSVGIRSLTLLDSTGRTGDLLVFDHAPAHVVAGLDDGDDTVVAEVAATDFPSATFDRARVAISFLRFTVDATVHVDALDVAGEVAAVQVLADDTELDGDTHDRGWWRWVFSAGAGGRFPVGGDTGSPIETLPAGGPLEMAVENGETVVYFDVSVLVDPGVEADVDVALRLNVHESFRWEDLARDPAYAEGVFDARPPGFEPIRRLGANGWMLEFQ